MKSSATPRTSPAPDGARETDPLFLQHLFAANVKLVRLSRRISQEELAGRAGLDRTYISSIERRLRNLSIQNIQRIAAALEVEPFELLHPGLPEDPRFLS